MFKPPLVVPAREARRLLGNIGVTKFYADLLPKLESYLEGRKRMVVYRSIEAHIEGQLQAQADARRDTREIAAKSVAVRRAKRAVQR